MYLKELYRHNKYWFAVILLFIACQLFINMKRGMVVSPFYHYGMYSQIMRPESHYPVIAIVADGDTLRTSEYNPQRWDKIMQPLLYYTRHKEENVRMYNEVQRITGIADSLKYVSNVQKKDFFDWYRKYLSQILDREIRSLIIEQKSYTPGR